MSSSPESPVRLLRITEVLVRTGIKSRSTIYDQVGQGQFPPPVHLTGKAIAFVESEIDAWIRSRIDARPAAVPAVKPARTRYIRPATTSTATTSTSTATPPAGAPPPRRRGPARTRAQRQQGLGQ